jgi:hypothetical protein
VEQSLCAAALEIAAATAADEERVTGVEMHLRAELLFLQQRCNVPKRMYAWPLLSHA